jgi:hypothetical protein
MMYIMVEELGRQWSWSRLEERKIASTMLDKVDRPTCTPFLQNEIQSETLLGERGEGRVTKIS